MPSHPSPASNARASVLRLRWAAIAGCLCSLVVAGSTGAQDGKLPPLPSAKSLSKQEREAAAAVQAPEVPQVAPLTPEPERPAPAPPLPPLPGPSAFTQPPSAPVPVPPALAPSASSVPPAPPALGVAPSTSLSGSAAKNANSTSPSGQFIIHGGDLTLRTAISSRCEEAAEDLRRLLRDTEPWALPVVTLLRVPPDINQQLPAVSTNIAQIAGGGFHLQITVQFRPDFRPADLQMELLRVLIAERILRNHNELSTSRTRILPDWLLTGIKEAMEFKHRSRPSAVFAAIFKSGKIYGIEEILDTEPGQLDGLSRTIYDTSCCALVLALLDQPDGPLRFRQFLSSLAIDEKPDSELLRKSFPGLALTGSSLNKWWSLQMAALATPSVFETLGPAETSQALAEALMFRFEVPPDQVPKPHAPVVAAASESKTSSRNSSTKRSEDAKPDTEPAPTEEPSGDEAEKKRGFLSRMFGGGGKEGIEEPDPKSKEKQAAEEPPKSKEKEKEKAEETPPPPAPEPEVKPESKSRKREKEKDKEETPPPADEPKPKKPKDNDPEKPKEAPKSDSNEEGAPRKGSGLNPLKWFRGGKDKEKETDKEADEKKDQAASGFDASSTMAFDQIDWSQTWTAASSALTSAWSDFQRQWLASSNGGAHEVFLGLGKKKKDGEPEAEAGTKDTEKEQAKAKAKDEKKESPEPEKTKKKPSKDESAADKPTPTEAEEGKPQEKKESHWFRRERKPGEAPPPPPPVETPEPEPKKSKPTPAKEKAEKPEPPAPVKETASSPEPLPLPTPLPAPAPTLPAMVPPSAPTSPLAPAPTEAEQSAAASKGMVAVALPIEDYAQVLKRKDKAQILQRTAQALTALNLRAHILFRPVINEYISVIADLTEGKTKGIDQRLQTIRRQAEAVEAQAKAVRDYVDYFQASESNEYSGTFDDYLKLPQQIERELPPRTDPISKYLDALDKEFSK